MSLLLINKQTILAYACIEGQMSSKFPRDTQLSYYQSMCIQHRKWTSLYCHLQNCCLFLHRVAEFQDLYIRLRIRKQTFLKILQSKRCEGQLNQKVSSLVQKLNSKFVKTSFCFIPINYSWALLITQSNFFFLRSTSTLRKPKSLNRIG